MLGDALSCRSSYDCLATRLGAIRLQKDRKGILTAMDCITGIRQYKLSLPSLKLANQWRTVLVGKSTERIADEKLGLDGL